MLKRSLDFTNSSAPEQTRLPYSTSSFQSLRPRLSCFLLPLFLASHNHLPISHIVHLSIQEVLVVFQLSWTKQLCAQDIPHLITHGRYCLLVFGALV